MLSYASVSMMSCSVSSGGISPTLPISIEKMPSSVAWTAAAMPNAVTRDMAGSFSNWHDGFAQVCDVVVDVRFG